MTKINPSVEAAREKARRASGEFGAQSHTAPDAEFTSRNNPLQWSGDQIEASTYEPPMRLAGMPPSDDFTGQFMTGACWVRDNGERPEDIRSLRRFAGQMSDDDFRDHYLRSLQLRDQQEGGSPDFDWDLVEDFDLDLKASYQRGGGRVAEDYLADAGTRSEGYMGGSKFEGYLAKNSSSLPQAEVAKRIREDVKAAKGAGYLPQDLKVSVRSRRGSMISGFSVRATVPDELTYIEGTHPWEKPDFADADRRGVTPFHPKRHPFAATIEERLEIVTNRHAERDVNSMVDFYQVHHDASVYIDSDDPDADNRRWREARDRNSAYVAEHGYC